MMINLPLPSSSADFHKYIEIISIALGGKQAPPLCSQMHVLGQMPEPILQLQNVLSRLSIPMKNPIKLGFVRYSGISSRPKGKFGRLIVQS